MVDKEKVGKFFWIVLFIILLWVSIKILSPFIISILSAILIAFFFSPLDEFLKKKLPGNVSRFLTLFIFLIILLGPLTAISFKIASEGMALNNRLGEFQELFDQCASEEIEQSLFCDVISTASTMRLQESNGFNFQITSRIINLFEDGIYSFTSYLYKIAFNIPIFLFYLSISLFISYFLLKDGKKFYRTFVDSIPLKKSHYVEIISSFKNILKGILYGNFLTALLQGIVASVVFLLFGVDSALFWGFFVAIIAFIPMIGAFFGWLPIILSYLVGGLINSSTTMIIYSIVFLVIAIFVTLSIDDILRPLLIGEKGSLHPLLVFLGVFGGITFIGPIGLFYGPFVLQITVNMINSFLEEILD
ncbi:MAG: AI-2E family transporter [Candidatus Woesearchaeota archaeon]